MRMEQQGDKVRVEAPDLPPDKANIKHLPLTRLRSKSAATGGAQQGASAEQAKERAAKVRALEDILDVIIIDSF